jgi:hypothetical protein
MQTLTDDEPGSSYVVGSIFKTDIDRVCKLATAVLGEAEVLSIILGCEEMQFGALQRYAQLPRDSWVWLVTCAEGYLIHYHL